MQILTRNIFIVCIIVILSVVLFNFYRYEPRNVNDLDQRSIELVNELRFASDINEQKRIIMELEYLRKEAELRGNKLFMVKKYDDFVQSRTHDSL